MNNLISNIPQWKFIPFQAASTTELSVEFKGATEVEEWHLKKGDEENIAKSKAQTDYQDFEMKPQLLFKQSDNGVI
jgi:hypothetical protein